MGGRLRDVQASFAARIAGSRSAPKALDLQHQCAARGLPAAYLFSIRCEKNGRREGGAIPGKPAKRRASAAGTQALLFRPLTPDLMDQLGTVLRGSWGAGCWCMFPRLARQADDLPGTGPMSQRRRA